MNVSELRERFGLPSPTAPRMDNLIATMWANENTTATLKDGGLDRIALAQGFDASEFRTRFFALETLFSREPQNSFETPEGK